MFVICSENISCSKEENNYRVKCVQKNTVLSLYPVVKKKRQVPPP
jgi:hypothetical protein